MRDFSVPGQYFDSVFSVCLLSVEGEKETEPDSVWSVFDCRWTVETEFSKQTGIRTVEREFLLKTEKPLPQFRS